MISSILVEYTFYSLKGYLVEVDLIYWNMLDIMYLKFELLKHSSAVLYKPFLTKFSSSYNFSLSEKPARYGSNTMFVYFRIIA